MSDQQPKLLTRFQIDMAIEAVEQVKAFIEDSGLDAAGERVASLSVAVSSLELVRKHWTADAKPKKSAQA